MSWRPIEPGLWIFEDSCNVYAIGDDHALLVVDAGTGAWLEALGELPGPVKALACTHYFRDHSAGAARAAERGIPIYVPEYERAIFADPAQHFRQRQTYIIYDNIWDLYAPIEPVPVAGVLRDYDKLPLAGVHVDVLPLPGATPTQIGLLAGLPSGRRVAFCGEAIHSPGKVPRLGPLQYNYNDLPGAVECYVSTQVLREHKPNLLLPSLGKPILTDVPGALRELAANLRTLVANRDGATPQLDLADTQPLLKVSEHVYRDERSHAFTWYVLSRSGKALAIDYGYDNERIAGLTSSYSLPERRRPRLHGLKALERDFGIDRIDVVLVSHFHDDHVCGIPLLQRLQNTRCACPENFAHILENPLGSCFPCTWPQPIRIDHRLPLNQVWEWEDYAFEFQAMNAHTRFSALIGFEADGLRFAHTGDQYFFGEPYTSFAGARRIHNQVYRNGALLDGMRGSGDWLLARRPNVVLQGHEPPMFTDEAFFKHVAAWSDDYERLHRLLMPLGDDQPHFNVDSWGGWIWPYRTHIPEPDTVTVTVTVRNPYPRPAKLDIRLVGPPGWIGQAATLAAAPRAEVTYPLTITPDGFCRRQPFAVELTADGRPFGQVAEAQITVGGSEF